MACRALYCGNTATGYLGLNWSGASDLTLHPNLQWSPFEVQTNYHVVPGVKERLPFGGERKHVVCKSKHRKCHGRDTWKNPGSTESMLTHGPRRHRHVDHTTGSNLESRELDFCFRAYFPLRFPQLQCSMYIQ